jgi:peroxiredoxin
LRDHVEDVRDADAALAAVGTGDVAYAEHFAEEHDIRFPLLVDDERRSYKVVGTKRGRAVDLAKPSVVRAGAAALARGRLQGRTGPAPMVLGAAHVIRPDGSVPYAWINEDVADNAPLDEVVAALVEA